MYILPPLTTLVASTLPKETTSPVIAIKLLPVILPLDVNVLESKDPVTEILPAVKLPRV